MSLLSTRQTNIRMPIELRIGLKVEAEYQGVSFSQIIRQLLTDGVEQLRQARLVQAREEEAS